METTRYYAVGATNGTASNAHRRRGLGYVYFLSMVMLVAVIGLSAVMYSRIQLRSARAGNDSITARFYAESALELGYAKIQADPNWRTNLGTGAWFTNQPIGRGTLSLDVTILADGDANPDNNPVLLIGTGVQGKATRKIQVTLGTLSSKGGMVTSMGSGMRSMG